MHSRYRDIFWLKTLAMPGLGEKTCANFRSTGSSILDEDFYSTCSLNDRSIISRGGR